MSYFSQIAEEVKPGTIAFVSDIGEVSDRRAIWGISLALHELSQDYSEKSSVVPNISPEKKPGARVDRSRCCPDKTYSVNLQAHE